MMKRLIFDKRVHNYLLGKVYGAGLLSERASDKQTNKRDSELGVCKLYARMLLMEGGHRCAQLLASSIIS
jgi:hypothetical protein